MRKEVRYSFRVLLAHVLENVSVDPGASKASR